VLTEGIFSASDQILPDRIVAEEDWFNAKRWNDEGSPCFYVENVCHESFSFFYDNSEANYLLSRYQPRWRLDLTKARVKQAGYPVDVIVADTSRNVTQRTEGAGCAYSPVVNHMVLYSQYNYMLGEFYMRTITAMLAMYRAFAGRTEAERAKSSWAAHTQLYMHVDSTKSIIDSHHLFLEAFSSNPVLLFRALLDRASCRCLRRLFFCGFQAKEDENATLVLTPSSNVWQGYRSGQEFSVGDKTELAWAERIYPTGRQHLLEMLTANNPSLEAQVSKFRKDALSGYIVEGNTHRRSIDNWTLVGLFQRKLRRSWMNFDDALRECNNRLNSRGVACIELNVELEYSNPLTQLVMHRAVDMVIGIHGAQLASALWMKDHSVLLELLPYVPDGVKGGFVRDVSRPTQLGVMFSGTPLNHVGHRLGPQSVPQCREFWEDHVAMVECVKKHRWYSRDFDVSYDVIEEAVTRFLLHENRTGCGSLTREANKGNHMFVLYNVYCSDGADGVRKVHHYYRQDENKGEPLS